MTLYIIKKVGSCLHKDHASSYLEGSQLPQHPAATAECCTVTSLASALIQ